MVKNYLGNYIDSKLIGVIQGDTNAEERKTIASKYDNGDLKIVIISKAGEEGVDFKRTGVILLADGVWTSAEYDQILGRAVRKNSDKRLVNGKINNYLDPTTIIPEKIECITLLLTSRHIKPPDVKYSGDLRQFKIILTKRAITKQVINQISPYFYKIMNSKDMVTNASEIGLNENYNDGNPRRKRSKSRRKRSKTRRKRSKTRSKRRI